MSQEKIDIPNFQETRTTFFPQENKTANFACFQETRSFFAHWEMSTVNGEETTSIITIREIVTTD